MNLRTVAILLMVAGAICFVAALILFPEQVLCMVGSTLITFTGLGIIITGRRRGWPVEDAVPVPRQAPQDQWASIRPRHRALPGLRVPARKPASAVIQPYEKPDNQSSMNDVIQVNAPHVSLVDQTAEILERQGARVRVEAQREDRGILRITTHDGRAVVAMVREDTDTVDVADVRSLFALMSSSASEGGYLIAAGPITERAYEWAGERQIHLVSADEMDELSV
jgi:hypothetical protein